MKYLAKIYVKNKDTLVLDCVNKEIENVCYPAGTCINPYNANKTAYRVGTLVIGSENIAISKEAIDLFRYIASNNVHSEKTMGDLGIHKTTNGKVAVNWSDSTHKEIGKQAKIIIGNKCELDIDLLNDLCVLPNAELLYNEEYVK